MDLEGIAAEKEGGEKLLIRKVCMGPNSPKMLGRPVAKVGLLAIWEGIQRVGIDVHPPVDHVPGHHFSLDVSRSTSLRFFKSETSAATEKFLELSTKNLIPSNDMVSVTYALVFPQGNTALFTLQKLNK